MDFAFSFETRLNQKDNSEIIEYAKEYTVLYGKMIRFTWHRIKNGGQLPMKKSDFNTLLQKTFSVNKRVASSVICEVIGIYKALYQLKWFEFFQLKEKITKKYKKYEKLQQKVYVLIVKTLEVIIFYIVLFDKFQNIFCKKGFFLMVF